MMSFEFPAQIHSLWKMGRYNSDLQNDILIFCLICHLSLHGGKMSSSASLSFFLLNLSIHRLKWHSSTKSLHLVNGKVGVKERHGVSRIAWFLLECGCLHLQDFFQKTNKGYWRYLRTAYSPGLGFTLCLQKM